MRTLSLFAILAALALAGCKKADNKPDNPNPNPDPNANPGPNPPGDRPAEVKELLDEVAKLNGYESNSGAKEADIVSLQFRSPGLKDADLERLRPLLMKSPVPVGLNLNGCEFVTDAGVAHLKDVATLRRLSLDSKKVTDAGLQPLATLADLEELYLSNDAITDAGLAHVAKLTKLKKLSVYSKKVTDAGYAHLAGLTNLEEIHAGGISTEIGDVCLDHMKGMTKLKTLSVGRDKLTDAGMAHLKNFTELRELRIEGPKLTPAGVAHLAPLKKLQKLTVLSGPFTGEALAALKDMSELRELELIYTHSLDKAGSLHIGKLTSLKKLRIGSVAEGGLEGIAGLTNLQNLDMNYSRVRDGDMKYLAGLTALEDLDVQHSEVTDAGLKHLAGLPKLRRVSAFNNRVTDAGLKHLAEVPNLEVIAAGDCNITGSGFKDLAKLTKLKELVISGNPVTDEHVLALKDLKSLKEVGFTGTKVSDEVALELKKARPDMQVRDSAGDDVALEKKPAPKRPPVEDIGKVEPAFKLTADAFYKEFEAGRNAAAEKYKGKVIELTGEVDTVGRNIGRDSYVTLKVENQLLGVMCYTADEQPWGKAVRGQKVTVKGKWPEFSVSPALIYCVFVDAGKYNAVQITAAELAKEFAADRDATVKKYDKKHLVITGEVVSKKYNSAGAATVELKTDGKVKVVCNFTAFEKDAAKPLKVGQTVKLLGEFTLNFGGDEVGLYFCLPLP